jgi:S-adenosylhomocysteine hydrolase
MPVATHGHAPSTATGMHLVLINTLRKNMENKNDVKNILDNFSVATGLTINFVATGLTINFVATGLTINFHKSTFVPMHILPPVPY